MSPQATEGGDQKSLYPQWLNRAFFLLNGLRFRLWLHMAYGLFMVFIVSQTTATGIRIYGLNTAECRMPMKLSIQ